MLTFIRKTFRRFGGDRSGLAAIEFAFIAPVMVTFLLGATELSNGMVADRKVSQVVSTLADLTSQDTEVTNAEMTNIFDCGTTIMSPLPTGTLAMRVTSVVADSNNIPRVAWSSGRGMSTRAVNSVVTVPAGMLTPGASVILD
jgi:Flp pilus assembly protein TadG